MRRFFSMLRKEFLQIRRDPQSLRLLFILPILQTLVLGYAMTRDVKNISLGILDLDRSPASDQISTRLAKNVRFKMQGNYASITDLQNGLRKGDIVIGAVIPKGFQVNVEAAGNNASVQEASEPARVMLLVDGQDASSAATAAGYASAVLSQWGLEHLERELLSQGLDASTLQPLDLEDRILFNPGLIYAWYMVPGMLILLVTMTGALLTSFSLVRERENGTLEQLMVTPVHPVQVILGKAIPYWLLSQVTFYLALAVTGWWYEIPLHSIHWGGLMLGLALYALTSVALGILVSTIVSSQQQALFLIWFFLISFILTSGFLLPFESMPIWMQNLTEFNGVRHFLYMVRALLLREAPPESLAPEYLKLMVISLTLFGGSLFLFRRKSA